MQRYQIKIQMKPKLIKICHRWYKYSKTDKACYLSITAIKKEITRISIQKKGAWDIFLCVDWIQYKSGVVKINILATPSIFFITAGAYFQGNNTSHSISSANRFLALLLLCFLFNYCHIRSLHWNRFVTFHD